MLRIEALSLNVGGFALHDITFHVNRGEYFVLLGASGVGKTLLLEAIAGLTPMTDGSVHLDGNDITHARIQNRRLGLVYQDHALFPHLTVRANIAYGKAKDSQITVESLAESVGVQDLLARKPGTLSGGESQRVALARALATDPKCLLLDEPLSALDAHARAELRALLRRLHRMGRTIIHVTHDYEEAVSLADRVAIMENGTITQIGTPEEVFQHPKSEFVARFVGIRNVLRGKLGIADANNDAKPFTAGVLQFWIVTEAPSGEGLLILRSEDITLSRSAPESSARNCFQGTITEITPARMGLEVCVDIGAPLTALVTRTSAEKLELATGKHVWLSFKASAAHFTGD